MDSGGDDALYTRLEGEKDGNGDVIRTEAAKPSPDSPDTSGGRRRSKRQVERSLLSANPAPGTEGCVRVFRTRGSKALRINGSDNGGQRTPPLPPRGRGKSTKTHSEQETASFSTMKRSNSRRASKSTLGPKLSKPRNYSWRPSAGAQNLTSAQTCQPEARVVTMSCEEECIASKVGDNPRLVNFHVRVADKEEALSEDPAAWDDPNGIINKQRLKMKQGLSQQKEVKTEESEKEEEESNVKKEESPEGMVQSEDEVQDNATTYRKRGRQQKVDKPAQTPKHRKKPPVQYVRCEMEGCGTVLAHPRYLQHHIKYQHLLKKKYVCDHPSCGRLFRLQKQLLRHAKHHTDQRDFICEYCARAFKSSHNLAVHRMIHTGEKPIQCEICGFTCRQKASLNWHMKKHDAESSYQFSCSICGKKFEKKDSIVAHKAKSHPEVLIAEAIAANGGSVIKSIRMAPDAAPKSVPETMPALASPTQPQVSQDDQEVLTLTPLHHVVLPLAPQTPLGESQSRFPQIPTHHVVQQTPTMLHLANPSAVHFPSTSHSPLIQLSALPPSSMLTPVSSALSRSPTAAPQQTIEWDTEDKDTQLTGNGELWDKVVEGAAPQDVGIIWDSNEEIKRKDEGIVWEGEGLRPVLLQCGEAHEDQLI